MPEAAFDRSDRCRMIGALIRTNCSFSCLYKHSNGLILPSDCKVYINMKMIMLDLKRRVLGLVLCGLAAFARGGSVADGACRTVSAEEVRSALESLDVYVREDDTAFRLLSVAEAQAVVEDVFSKERPYRAKRIQARLKRLLAEGKFVGLMGCAVKRMGADVFKRLPKLHFAVGPRRFGLISRGCPVRRCVNGGLS